MTLISKHNLESVKVSQHVNI